MISPLSSSIARTVEWRAVKPWLRELSRARILAAVLTLALLFNAIFLFVYLLPSYRQERDLEDALAKVHSRLSELVTYRKAREDLEQLQGRFLSQEELATIPDQLPGLASRYRLSIPQVRYQQLREKQAGLYRTILIQYSLVGRYTNIRRFLHELEKDGRFLFVRDLSIGGSQRDREALSMDVQMIALVSDG